jgi:cellulose synthase (UDP-forming)
MRNYSRKVYDPPMLKLISLIAIIYFVYYLVWRASSTINPAFPFFSWLLWGAEAFGVITYILFAWQTQKIAPSEPFTKPKSGMKVDVFVPTYNESLDILEATLIGCKNIRYNHMTYILDDGNREEVRKLALRLDANYIARPTHEHAKAGNINYALQHTDGEFIVVLDADMVPQPEFLDRTLGYFEDPSLALVQLPQEFYNLDSIQHSKNQTSWHEQSLFFRVIQPGKNYSNSAFWCGSPSVVRRTAINSVGGVATETITEDIHTTVRLHSRGWKTLFVNEPLAYGIAPQTIRAFLLQRLRWAQGTMQLYRSKESPLWIRGLTIKQRLSYLSSFLAYWESFQKFILLSMPIAILVFGVFPMQVNFLEFVVRWTIYFLLNIFANQMGGRGVFHYFKTEKFNILKTIIFMQSTLTLFSRKPLTFKVTPKNLSDDVYSQERKSMRSFMAIFGSLIGAIGYSIYRMIVIPISQNTFDIFLVAFFWGIYNTIIIYVALKEVFSKKHERKDYRFPVQANARLYASNLGSPYLNSRVSDLSISGAGVVINGDLPALMSDVWLEIDPVKFSNLYIPVKQIFQRENLSSGKNRIGVFFREDLGAQRELLFEYLFIYQARMMEGDLYRINLWDPFRTLEQQYQ